MSDFDKFQQTVLQSYGDHIVEVPGDVAVCGDSLLRFLLSELSESEGCDNYLCAVSRLDSAIRQLETVRDAMIAKAESEEGVVLV